MHSLIMEQTSQFEFDVIVSKQTTQFIDACLLLEE